MAMKLKALALALAAAFALSAVAASAASADELHSGSTTGTTHLTADQHTANVLHTPSGNIQCTTLTGSGTYSGTTVTEETVEGIGYDNCTAFGLTAHIDTMGCDYTLTGKTSATATVEIDCPTTGGGVTDDITITPTQGGAAICHINVPSQVIPIHVTNTIATPSGIPDDVDASVEEGHKLIYSVERTAGGSKCPSNGLHEDGIYTGSITVTAFQDAAHTERVGLTYT